MGERLDLIGVGAANVDLLLKVDRFPRPDEEVAVRGFSLEGGGSAANVVVGVARLGFKTGFIGCVGRDEFGRLLLEEFRREGVDSSHVRLVDARTGVAVSIVDEVGERALLVYGEANEALSPEDVREEYVGRARAIVVTSIQGDQALAALERASEHASRHELMMLFDPGCILVERGVTPLKGILERATVAKFNEREALSLTGAGRMEEALSYLRRTGVKNFIVTLGERGCLVSEEGGVEELPPYGGFKAVDRTGAGDAFNVGLLAGMLRGWKLVDSAKFGNLIAAITVTRMGARAIPSLPDLAGYREFKEFKGRI